MKIALTIFILIVVLLSCNKDKQASKRFMKPEEWKITSLQISDSTVTELPTWSVNNCEIYEEKCIANWNIQGKSSSFYWQFNDKAREFVIARVVLPEDCEDFYTVKAEQQTYKFSGSYKVIETSKSKKIVESYATLGFEGEKVVIEIEN